MEQRSPKSADESKTIQSIRLSNHLLHFSIGAVFVGAIGWSFLPDNIKSKVTQVGMVGVTGVLTVARFANRNAYLGRVLGVGDIVTELGKVGLDPGDEKLIVHLSKKEQERFKQVSEFVEHGTGELPISGNVAQDVLTKVAGIGDLAAKVDDLKQHLAKQPLPQPAPQVALEPVPMNADTQARVPDRIIDVGIPRSGTVERDYNEVI